MDKTLALEYLQQGELLLKKGCYENAIIFFQKAEKEDPFNRDIYIDMGVSYANLDQYENAEKSFLKALQVSKDVGVIYFHLGNICFLKDDKAKGIQYYNLARSKGYEDAQMYFSLGLLFEEDGDSALALRNYNKAIMIDPLRSDARIRKARLYINNKQYPEALQTLDDMIMACPDVFEGYHLKYKILNNTGDYEKAQQVLDKARILFPNDLGFILDQADLFINLKQYDNALAILDEAEKKDQDIMGRHGVAIERARISALTNNMDKTIFYLKEAKRMYTEMETPTIDFEATFFLMNCYMNIENYAEALSCARELKEEKEGGYYYLSSFYYEPFCLQKLQQENEAMSLYHKNVEELRDYSLKNPSNMDCYFFRILCLKELKNYEKALELTKYLLMINEDMAEAYTLRALIFTEMGREEEAAREKAKAREIGGHLNGLAAIQ